MAIIFILMTGINHLLLFIIRKIVFIFALVNKQWGYTFWEEAGNPVNVTLPLPFPKNDYLIVACAYGGIDNFHTAALNTVTSNITSNAKYQLATYDYNRRYNYIAIGF